MVSQSRIIDLLKMYEISEVIKFIEDAIENWSVKLTAGGKSLTEVKIQRDLQGRCVITIPICNKNDASESYI